MYIYSKYSLPKNIQRSTLVNKRQDFSAAGEGQGANEGIVLPMTLVGNSAYDA